LVLFYVHHCLLPPAVLYRSGTPTPSHKTRRPKGGPQALSS
jgi:hypothetical protein